MNAAGLSLWLGSGGGGTSSEQELLPCSAPPHHSQSSETNTSHRFDPEKTQRIRTPDASLLGILDAKLRLNVATLASPPSGLRQ